MDEDIARCRTAGFESHLTKPVNFVKLEEAIQTLGINAAGIDCNDQSENGREN